MGQLYRWLEKKTGKIVYVGMVAGNTLADIHRRIKSEKSQLIWAKETEYQIQYLAGSLMGKLDFSPNETKALETHFINLYETGKNGYRLDREKRQNRRGLQCRWPQRDGKYRHRKTHNP